MGRRFLSQMASHSRCHTSAVGKKAQNEAHPIASAPASCYPRGPRTFFSLFRVCVLLYYLCVILHPSNLHDTTRRASRVSGSGQAPLHAAAALTPVHLHQNPVQPLQKPKRTASQKRNPSNPGGWARSSFAPIFAAHGPPPHQNPYPPISEWPGHLSGLRGFV